MKRTKLKDRTLPRYSQAEERMNMITHIAGDALGLVVLVSCVLRAVQHQNTVGITASVIYGVSMVALYTMSSIYHGMKPCTAKKVMQILDHCTIYFLIAGTYTPIMLCTMAPRYPAIGWGLFLAQWVLVAIATVLTAIDLRRYRIFSMICYIGMGWGIVLFIPQLLTVLHPVGFTLVLAGGIVYTIGAVLYSLGSKRPWMHTVFHIFVVLGSLLQYLAIILFVL